MVRPASFCKCWRLRSAVNFIEAREQIYAFVATFASRLLKAFFIVSCVAMAREGYGSSADRLQDAKHSSISDVEAKAVQKIGRWWKRAVNEMEIEITVHFRDMRVLGENPPPIYCNMFVLNFRADMSVSSLSVAIVEKYLALIHTDGDYLHLASMQFKQIIFQGLVIPALGDYGTPLTDSIRSLRSLGFTKKSDVTVHLYEEHSPEFASFFQKHPSQS